MSPQGKDSQVTVIGAGIVGVCCALYLQRDGYQVTILDQGGPGEGCSQGSGGQFVAGYCVPVGMPGIVKAVPGMLLDPLGPLTIRWRYLPRLLPWLLRFVAASSVNHVESIAKALYTLTREPLETFSCLLRRARAEHLIVPKGRLDVFLTDRTFEKTRPKFELLARRGVKLQFLDSKQIGALEPTLSDKFSRGVFFPETSHTTDPLRLTQLLALDFTRRGGHILRQKVISFEIEPAGSSTVCTNIGRHKLNRLVLATGAHSKGLAALLGSRLPLDTERGYHLMLPRPGIELKRAVVCGDYYFGMTPMQAGLRLAGTVEFAGIGAPPNYSRADNLLHALRRILPDVNADGATRWMGCRPSMPDSLPVIGRSPKHDSVYFAFGHGHLGLTAAAMTGKLITELVSGRPTSIDTTPFRPDRFKTPALMLIEKALALISKKCKLRAF